jgi:hypothetical protein
MVSNKVILHETVACRIAALPLHCTKQNAGSKAGV